MSQKTVTRSETRLGFVGLAALVFGMMVGAGIFNIPQNMALSAGPLATAAAWIITAAGMLLLVSVFRTLSIRQPELNAGLYLYARQGFGAFAGYLTAWGYWLCTAFANVAYAVMLNDTLGALFPPLLDHGWQTLIFGSMLIWFIFFFVITGLRTAALFNTVISIVKIACIFLIIILLCAHFRLDTLTSSILNPQSSIGNADFGTQVKDTMLVTLWCFIGIEGAVMMSGRARSNKDVGKAGVAGFFSAWILYVLVSLLCFGVMTRARLAGLPDPSVAYVLKSTCGQWAYWLVIASVTISLGGGWVAWSLVTAEVPYTAARCGLFPRRFALINRHGIPAFGLFVSSIIMELFLIIVMFSEHLYLTALSVTGMMILPAYLLTSLYLLKSTLKTRRSILSPEGACGSDSTLLQKRSSLIVPLLSTIFCAWMIYAGGIDLFLRTSVYYLAGLPFLFKARREQHRPFLSRRELAATILLASIAIFS